MGDINQVLYLKNYLPEVDGPVLEIGSKDYGSTTSFRDVYVNSDYIGLDMEGGKGVDVVQDLTEGIGHLNEKYFSLVICCSVLEHVRRPWIMADNITRIVKPGGKLYMSVPWVWRYHAYPDDYFRFSHRGIKELFPEFYWEEMLFSSTAEKEFFQIVDDTVSQVDNQLAAVQVTETGGKRKYLPYLMVNMLGTKK